MVPVYQERAKRISVTGVRVAQTFQVRYDDGVSARSVVVAGACVWICAPLGGLAVCITAEKTLQTVERGFCGAQEATLSPLHWRISGKASCVSGRFRPTASCAVQKVSLKAFLFKVDTKIHITIN